MSSFNNVGNQGSKSVKSVNASKFEYSEVKNKVSIPMYFYNIIVPQLGSYYDLYPVDFDQKIVVCCPIHDEDTPSFRYYESTSSFYCFGCQRGGDIVELHRYFAEKLNGTRPDRDEAVAFLYTYFLQGNETQSFIVTDPELVEKKSTDAEVVKLNTYRFRLEQSISFDKLLKDEVKKELWEILDSIDLLLSKDLINATEAEKYIKQAVKRLITIDATNKRIIYNGKVKENV